MTPIFRVMFITCICFFAISGAVRAEKAYLYIDGIPGESIDSQHTDWIDIESWQWQVSSSLTSVIVGGGGTAGTAIVRPVIVLKHIDKSSPLLAIAVFKGQHIVNAIIDTTSDTGNSVLRITLNDVVVSNASIGDSLTESVALIFGKICYHYTPFSPDGAPQTPIDKCWDLHTNTEG